MAFDNHVRLCYASAVKWRRAARLPLPINRGRGDSPGNTVRSIVSIRHVMFARLPPTVADLPSSWLQGPHGQRLD